MEAFALTKHPEMVLSAGASALAGEHVTAICGANARVLLVADPAMVALGHAQRIEEAIKGAGHAVSLFTDLTSDPKESAVDAATALAHEKGVNCVVGLGGGSALDTSKVVAALAESGAPCAAFRLAQTQLPFRRTAMITMPTTAGTGSETTGTSIISEENGTKNWFWGPPLKPDMALMDPELTVGLPPYWTFYTGMDALVHAIEARTNRFRHAANDPLAERAIVAAMDFLERAVSDGSDIEARSGMMVAAAYGGLAIGNVGTALAHNVGHALGSLAHVPHGRAVSVSLVHTLPWVMEGNREAFETIAGLMGLSSATQIGDRLHALAAACGEQLALTNEEKAHVSTDALAKAMLEPANIAMLQSTARDASPEDVADLAHTVLAA